MKWKRSIVFWALAMVWMIIIFSASGQTLSFQETSRFLGPLLRWLFPGISDPDFRLALFIIRKCGHLTEYAILALLCFLALRHTGESKPAVLWHRKHACWALLIVFLYAASDEFHQSLVPARQGAVHDVLIDTTGGAIALLLVWACTRGLRRTPAPVA